ncbi:MAG TPA: HD domain-containing phosphohydrolase [Noviherbaspirillum sp.]|nr:HD domain-containing phosphohydrolase [Noviherbaspirillum sp.]
MSPRSSFAILIRLRVATLARAIGEEMGLSPHQIEGMHLAASIHDVGKIRVQAEILNRPGKLMPLELELIRTHAQSGYDIVKDVRFPWPIARIIVEHHERVDGSGYPNRRRGDQLLLESKIVTVADVVEAMTSHRPYRPGLGLDAALEHIAEYRSVWYDAAVVDACLRLFRENRFRFESMGRAT